MDWQTGLVEIDKGVYAYIQPRGTWFVSNAGLIVGRGFSLIIDSLTNETMAMNFLREARKVMGDSTRLFLVNTHYHGDHTWTNHLFNAITIAHINTRELIMEEARLNLMSTYRQLFPDIDFTGARYTPQDLAFTDSITFHMGDKAVEVRYVGHPAHTTGDVYVYLPDSRVVFTGDLLFAEPCTPFVLFGSMSGSIEVLDHLASMNAEVYVPGHGPLVYGKRALYRARDYLTYVRDESWRRFRSGMPYAKAARDIDLGEYSSWFDRERIVGNVARAYSEFRNEPLGAPLRDLNEVILEMLKYRNETSQRPR